MGRVEKLTLRWKDSTQGISRNDQGERATQRLNYQHHLSKYPAPTWSGTEWGSLRVNNMGEGLSFPSHTLQRDRKYHLLQSTCLCSHLQSHKGHQHRNDRKGRKSRTWGATKASRAATGEKCSSISISRFSLLETISWCHEGFWCGSSETASNKGLISLTPSLLKSTEHISKVSWMHVLKEILHHRTLNQVIHKHRRVTILRSQLRGETGNLQFLKLLKCSYFKLLSLD